MVARVFWRVIVGNFGVSVTIGRNIGSMPMVAIDWERFQYVTLSAFRNAAGADNFDSAIFEQGEGEGIWEDVQEDNYRVAIHGLSETVARSIAYEVGDRMAFVAKDFRQDAVAVGVVESFIVEAK